MTYIKRIHWDWETFFKRVRPTVLCAGLSLVAFILMQGHAKPGKVVCLDIYLIGVFFLFRGLKALGTRKEFTKGKEIKETDVSPATKNKMNVSKTTGPSYPLMVIQTNTKFNWRIVFFIVAPALTIVICGILYYKL